MAIRKLNTRKRKGGTRFIVVTINGTAYHLLLRLGETWHAFGERIQQLMHANGFYRNFKMVYTIGGVEHTEIAENVEDGFDATPVPPGVNRVEIQDHSIFYTITVTQDGETSPVGVPAQYYDIGTTYLQLINGLKALHTKHKRQEQPDLPVSLIVNGKRITEHDLGRVDNEIQNGDKIQVEQPIKDSIAEAMKLDNVNFHKVISSHVVQTQRRGGRKHKTRKQHKRRSP